MKQTRSAYFLVFAFLLCSLFSCKKNSYKNDGGVHNEKVNMTTYEYLSSKPIFDSLVKAIDLAGLKDLVNSNITFFAVTNWGVNDYMLAKKQQKIIAVGNENISFSMDSLDKEVLGDSLKMYMFDGLLTRDKLNTKGAYYQSLFGPMAGDKKLYLKLRRTLDYNAYVDYVDYLNYTMVIGTLDADEPVGTQIPPTLRDRTEDCQTSGIITTTGVIHVLNNYHRLFFNTEPLP
ncbi:hypothetical protein [Parasegetibacter sp. NRK P23]|uniref:hypothetical protein n=1 Tax=Parasegetibacter sp. NRK P23 TaxID=2942999 RepID=UPI00204480AF|nr:hypothetical protein [Parasegetibacter sp. NRK P23]MCM5530593.1 hypothetical protein [Parasegetibacter sp. NRK P23]